MLVLVEAANDPSSFIRSVSRTLNPSDIRISVFGPSSGCIAVQDLAQRPDRRVARALQLIRQLVRRVFDFLTALDEGSRAGPETRALASGHLIGNEAVAFRHLHRLGRGHDDGRGPQSFQLARHSSDGFFDAIAVALSDKRRGRAADREADGRDSIRRRQPVDERVRRRHDGRRASRPDMGLVDSNRNQAATRRVFIRAVALGNACRSFRFCR